MRFNWDFKNENRTNILRYANLGKSRRFALVQQDNSESFVIVSVKNDEDDSSLMSKSLFEGSPNSQQHFKKFSSTQGVDHENGQLVVIKAYDQ